MKFCFLTRNQQRFGYETYNFYPNILNQLFMLHIYLRGCVASVLYTLHSDKTLRS